MTEPGSQLRSRAWQDVDGSTSPSEFADYLDALEQASSASRLESVLLLGIEAGGAALDVGCGTGKVVIDLGRLVATGGRAVGVDVSKAMIATARARAEAADVAVELVVGDAHALHFRDDTFDAVHCDRVLQHLDDPSCAIAEMARVLAPGGRLVMKEPDWEGLFVDATDGATTRRVRDTLAAGIRQPTIGRKLRGLALGAGLELVDFHGSLGVYAVSRAAADRVWRLSDQLARAVELGTVDDETARAWWDDLGARDDAGRFFAGVIGFRLLARKPR